MDKKGVEIALNVVIITIVLLLVVVILVLLLTGKAKSLSSSQDCVLQGGVCAIACGSDDYKTADYPTQNPAITCPVASTGENQICCLKIAG